MADLLEFIGPNGPAQRANPERTTAAVSDAWRCVAAGYEAALTVAALPPVEVDALRACLRAARQIAQDPQLHPVRGEGG